jgi:sulfite reductase (NADPH) flavoprotein alpha-component
LLLPVIVIALSGVWLSLEKFNLIPDQHTQSEDAVIVSLDQMPLSKIKKITLPFSTDPEDFYLIETSSSSMEVLQGSGSVQQMQTLTWSGELSHLAFDWHTGTGSIWWSIILLLSSLGILYFIYSGTVMSYRRLRKNTVAFTADPLADSEFMVLVGSESGTTRSLAESFCVALQQAGKKVHLDVLDGFSAFATCPPGWKVRTSQTKELIVFTSTYGDGGPPSSAKDFEHQMKEVKNLKDLHFSVVAFGSLDYPKYCAFGIKTDQLLDKAGLVRVMPLVKIDDQHLSEVRGWASRWGRRHDIGIHMELPAFLVKKTKTAQFAITNRVWLEADETFLIWLSPKNRTRFTSGDLLEITPPESQRARHYSIARIDDQILLSIKHHDHGQCSSWLKELPVGTEIQAAVASNPDFHFPTDAKEVSMIANGTGIAPFLGMICASRKTNFGLYWGGRTTRSFDAYENIITTFGAHSNLTTRTAISRPDPAGSVRQQYVQDLVQDDLDLIIEKLDQGAYLMICGSILMQEEVLGILETAFAQHPSLSRQILEDEGRLRMDCY